jgi:molybdopterin synthase catalytic subunit
MDRSSPVIDVRLADGPVRYRPIEPFPQPAGAEAVFLGRTREERHTNHGDLRRLEYEAYSGMAERVLHELAEEAVERFRCLVVRLHHAVGDVPPGEASVLVQVVTGHRAEAFDACRFLIDELKTRAPIWKREHWADGTTWADGQPVTTPETDHTN